MFETAARADRSDGDGMRVRRTTHRTKTKIKSRSTRSARTGSAFEVASLREAEDGEAFPSPAAVFHEFRAMIAALREDKNGDRARVQDKADKKFAKLEDVLADPSALYKLHRFSRSPGFQLFIYFCIAAVTVTSGLETSRARSPATRPSTRSA